MSKLNDAELALDELKLICQRLGWDVLIDLENDTIFGLIVGTREYIEAVVEGSEDMEEYTYIDTNEDPDVVH